MKTGKLILAKVGRHRPQTSAYILFTKDLVTSSIMPDIVSEDLFNFWRNGIGQINPDMIGGYNGQNWR